MDITFKQKIILAVIAGVFALWAAQISSSGNSNTSYSSMVSNQSAISNGGNTVVITNGGNAINNGSNNSNISINN
jgi:hypothetical protein